REVWPMQFVRSGLKHLSTGGVAANIERIDVLWTRCRRDFGGGGGFLFGDFSIADAMYAPVVSRFMTYGPLDLSDDSAAYMKTISATSAWAKWEEGAKTELSSG
ncbi:MAG: glutathione S-transferase, partial [Marinicaulis sp.]|nr:glutathione S-transferase [Marinicaulis sp.]